MGPLEAAGPDQATGDRSIGQMFERRGDFGIEGIDQGDHEAVPVLRERQHAGAAQ